MTVESKISLELSKDNYLVAKVNIDGKYKYIGSKYNMKSCIDKFIDKIDNVSKDSIFIIFGLGSGEHIKYLMNEYKNNIIIVFEPNKELFNYALVHDEYKWMREASTILFYEYSAKNLVDIMRYKIATEKVSRVKIYHCFNYDILYKEEYYNFLENMKRVNEEKIVDLNTKIVFSKIWFENMIGNLKCICNSEIADFYKDRYRDNPAIIVSAGPSFDKSIDILKDVKEKMLIFTGGRNLKALLKEDIQPNLLAIVDPVEESYQIVKECIGECESPLLFYEGTNTNAVNAHKADKIIYTQSRLIRNVFERNICDLGYGGSIAHILTKFSIDMGCNPIIFVGQDLAYSNDNLHADSTKTVGKDYSNMKEKMISVEKYGGQGNVKTSESLDTFRKQLEGLIANNKNITFINCSEGGARINGTVEMNLRDAIEKYSSRVNKLIYKDDTIDRASVKKNANEVLNNGLNEAAKLIKLSKEGLSKIDAYRSSYLEGNSSKFNKICDELTLIDKKISDIYNSIYLFEKVLFPIILWANKQVYNNESDYKTKLEFINEKRNTKKKFYDILISTCEYVIEEIKKANIEMVCENETGKE